MSESPGLPDVPDRGQLSTEGVSAASAELDRLPTERALALLLDGERRAVEAVDAARGELAAAVDLVAARLASGGRLFYAGAGTSGRLGVLDAAECPPTFQSDPAQVQGVIAGGLAALTGAVEGAEDDPGAGAAAMAERGLGPQDVLVGISAGGTTPFVHGALREARGRGAATVLVACVPRDQVPDEADLSVRVVTGPEVLAGSTRLKAATATKLVLNAISTLAMVRLGKVHGNLMVDLDAGANRKLVDRAVRILVQLLGLERGEARALLERARGRVKVAALMHAHELDRTAAEEHLARCGNRLRPALESPPTG